MLSKADLKRLLEDDTKKRCEDLELLLELDSDIMLYTFVSEKYLVYFMDENVGVLYDSLDELKAVSTPPIQLPDYEIWLKDINLHIGDIDGSEKLTFPELQKLLKIDVVDFKQTKKIEAKLLRGNFMDYNPILYKEFLLYLVEYLRFSCDYLKLLLEMVNKDEYELFVQLESKAVNLTGLVWEEFFEPEQDFFSTTKSIFL